jgi:N-formylglutamate amidohydrolase
MDPAFTIVGGQSPVVATAVHAGHALRPEVADAIALDDATRRREEDPATDRMISFAPTRVTVDRSRFEVDLNRSRDLAVYARPEDAWGLRVWSRPPPDELVARSVSIYDAFYAVLGAHLDPLAGPFVVLDVHSYNHRRGGPGAPDEPAADNPDVNVGTGSVDRVRWGPLVDRFMGDLAGQEAGGHRLDVRENVRFRGGHLALWVNSRYPGRGCALAIEMKKTYMDEWTGEVDDGRVDEISAALAATVPGILDVVGAATR